MHVMFRGDWGCWAQWSYAIGSGRLYPWRSSQQSLDWLRWIARDPEIIWC